MTPTRDAYTKTRFLVAQILKPGLRVEEGANLVALAPRGCPLPFESVATPGFMLHWYAVVTVLYLVASDMFHVVRLVSYSGGRTRTRLDALYNPTCCRQFGRAVMPRFGYVIWAVVASASVAMPFGPAQSGVSRPKTQPSLAIKASIGTYRLDAGDTLTGELTITNLSDQVLELCPWSDSCTVHVIGEKGEPPTTYRQRDATHRLLPGEAPLGRTLYAGWFIAPGKTDTHHWILKDLYDLSAPGKYTLYFDVRDPKTEEMLRSNTAPFTVAAPSK